MIDEFIYEGEIEDTEETFSLEVHYEYFPGHKAYVAGLPEYCHPAEGPEVYILWVADTHGNELLDDEWQAVVSEDTLIEAITKLHRENENDVD